MPFRRTGAFADNQDFIPAGEIDPINIELERWISFVREIDVAAEMHLLMDGKIPESWKTLGIETGWTELKRLRKEMAAAEKARKKAAAVELKRREELAKLKPPPKKPGVVNFVHGGQMELFPGFNVATSPDGERHSLVYERQINGRRLIESTILPRGFNREQLMMAVQLLTTNMNLRLQGLVGTEAAVALQKAQMEAQMKMAELDAKARINAAEIDRVNRGPSFDAY